MLAADEQHVAGLLLQVLPDSQQGSVFETRRLERDWALLTAGAEALDPHRLLHAPVTELLPQAFPAHPVRLHPASTPLAFRCTCSRERTGRALLSLPQADLEELLEARGWVEVNCEFCGSSYRFGRTELAESTADR